MLTPEVIKKAQGLLDQGYTRSDVAQELEDVNISGVGYSVERDEIIAREKDYHLID